MKCDPGLCCTDVCCTISIQNKYQTNFFYYYLFSLFCVSWVFDVAYLFHIDMDVECERNWMLIIISDTIKWKKKRSKIGNHWLIRTQNRWRSQFLRVFVLPSVEASQSSSLFHRVFDILTIKCHKSNEQPTIWLW